MHSQKLARMDSAARSSNTLCNVSEILDLKENKSSHRGRRACAVTFPSHSEGTAIQASPLPVSEGAFSPTAFALRHTRHPRRRRRQNKYLCFAFREGPVSCSAGTAIRLPSWRPFCSRVPLIPSSVSSLGLLHITFTRIILVLAYSEKIDFQSWCNGSLQNGKVNGRND